MRRPRSILAATGIAVALTGPNALAAKKQPVYELQLKGSQVVTWSYGHIGDGKCDLGANGEGSQQATYGTGKVRVVTVKPRGGPKAGFPQLALKSDRLAKYEYAPAIPAVVSVEREGTMDQRAACGGTGGGGQGPQRDCGTRHGRVQLEAGWDNLVGFRVGGSYDNFSMPSGDEALNVPIAAPTSGDPLGHTFENCPILLATGSRAADELLSVTKQLSQRKLPRKGRTLKISGGDVEELKDPDGERSSRTVTAWNLKLKRIR